MGERIFDAIFPQIGTALRVAQGGIVERVLSVATGINFPGLQADVARRASAGIYRAIGREEAAIRADPQGAGDPVLSGVFGLARR
jgi:hypothetical protein